jgi:hypothetical protein
MVAPWLGLDWQDVCRGETTVIRSFGENHTSIHPGHEHGWIIVSRQFNESTKLV